MKILIKLVVIVVILSVTSFANAKYFSKPGWFINMWVPDSFEYIPGATKLCLGKYTDGISGAIIINAIDNKEFRNLKSISMEGINNIFEGINKTKEATNSYLVYHQFIDTDNGHSAFVAEYKGLDPEIIYYVVMHGQQYYITFHDLYSNVYDRNSIKRTIDSIYCSYE